MAKAFASGVYLFSPRARRASSYPSPNTPTLTLTLNLNLTLILTLTLTCTAAHFGQRQESVPQMLASPPPRQELLAGRDGGVQACRRGAREAVCDHRATARLLGAGGKLGHGHHDLLQRRNREDHVRQAGVRDSDTRWMQPTTTSTGATVSLPLPRRWLRFGCMLSSRCGAWSRSMCLCGCGCGVAGSGGGRRRGRAPSA